MKPLSLTLETYGQRSHGEVLLAINAVLADLKNKKKEKCRTERVRKAYFTSVRFDKWKAPFCSHAVWLQRRMTGHSSSYMTDFPSTCVLSNFLFKEGIKVEQTLELRKPHLGTL
jgi:hypothetical protein